MLTDTHGKPFAGRVFARATLENALRSDWTVQILNTENEHFNCFFNLQVHVRLARTNFNKRPMDHIAQFHLIKKLAKSYNHTITLDFKDENH